MAVKVLDSQSNRTTTRRWELYQAAAPLLARDGFRGVTIDALARACLISPAGLYHYFPNKAMFAVFPLSHESGLCASWKREVAALPVDPLIRLQALIAFLVAFSEPLRLAYRMTFEIAGDRRYVCLARSILKKGEEDFLAISHSVDPNLSDARAKDLFEEIAAILVSDPPGMSRSANDLARQMRDAARGWAVSLGIDPTAFDIAARPRSASTVGAQAATS